MAVTYTQQYYPVTTTETAEGAALSSHGAREMMRSVNNLKAYVANTMLIPNAAGMSGGARLRTTTGNTNENHFLHFARTPVPWGTKAIRIVCGAYISSHAGGGTITLRAYADTQLYTGTFSALAVSDSETVSSATHAIFSFTLGSAANPISNITHVANIDQAIASGYVYLAITSQCSNATDQATVTSIAAWADGSSYT